MSPRPNVPILALGLLAASLLTGCAAEPTAPTALSESPSSARSGESSTLTAPSSGLVALGIGSHAVYTLVHRERERRIGVEPFGPWSYFPARRIDRVIESTRTVGGVEYFVQAEYDVLPSGEPINRREALLRQDRSGFYRLPQVSIIVESASLLGHEGRRPGETQLLMYPLRRGLRWQSSPTGETITAEAPEALPRSQSAIDTWRVRQGETSLLDLMHPAQRYWYGAPGEVQHVLRQEWQSSQPDRPTVYAFEHEEILQLESWTPGR